MGIDLGTTNSCVAIIENGKPKVLENDSGHLTTPSIVAFTKEEGENQMLVGEAARRQSVLNPKNTIYGAKRLIGRRFDSPEVKTIQKHVPYDIVAAPNGSGDAWIKAGGKAYSPSQIGAFVLSKMRETAERYVGQTMNKAVITVPAYFNDSQRQATKDAGEIAGLQVLRIINEPTAASLAYGFGGAGNQAAKSLAVFDLGGGTFDVSILELGDGMCQVVSTNGDTFLGGEDFDEVILQHLIQDFKKKSGIDLSNDMFALQRLREGAEKAKKDLDHVPRTEINLPFIHKDKNFSYVLSKDKFEELITPLVERTVKPCLDAMKDASLNRVDNVILVGGMTRTPIVARKVAEIFNREASKGVNPDEVVAVGAAVQGGVIKGSVSSLILVDVTPLSLGVGIEGDIFSRIIKRNSSIPCSNTQTYITSKDGQSKVDFDIYQGEREVASKNHKLGHVTLPVLPAPKGVAKIDVTFAIDVNGIVNITATDPVMKKTKSVQLQASGGLSKNDIERMLKEAQEQKEQDEKIKKEAEARNAAESLILTAENDYLSNEVVSEEAKEKIRQAIAEVRKALDAKQPIEEISKQLNDAIMAAGAEVYSRAQQQQSSDNTPPPENNDQQHKH